MSLYALTAVFAPVFKKLSVISYQVMITLVITLLRLGTVLLIYSLFFRGFCKGRGIASPAWKVAKACLPSRIPLDVDGGPSFLFSGRPRTQALPAQRRSRGDRPVQTSTGSGNAQTSSHRAGELHFRTVSSQLNRTQLIRNRPPGGV